MESFVSSDALMNTCDGTRQNGREDTNRNLELNGNFSAYSGKSFSYEIKKITDVRVINIGITLQYLSILFFFHVL